MVENITSTSSSLWLFNRTVRDDDGHAIGRLRDIIVHVPRGTIAYAVIGFSQACGRSEQRVAVPWTHLRIDEVRHRIILPGGRDVLRDAPPVEIGTQPDFSHIENHARWYAMLRKQPAPQATKLPVLCFELE